MEFVFPVVDQLTPRRLAAAFERHGAPAALPEYGSRLARLGFEPLAGFLRGFVDLVFEHGGRWYVLDWKSNFLGPAPDDYRRERLVHSMAHHHYFLQYHLYVVALHRHLVSRLPGYAYESHFGGVFYVFVRGAGSGGGVFHDRPPRALVEDLSACMGGQA
jgi:exodeoxyribonuclease V beta subunit